MIKAVIFDLDGTLIDSIGALCEAFDSGVKAFQLPPVSKERLLECIDRGERMPRIMSVLYPDLDLEEGSPLLTAIQTEIRKRYPGSNSEKVGLMPGARELLDAVKQRGLKMAVVTSRTMPVERLQNELKELEIADLMEAVVTSVDSKRKPAPDTIIKCLEMLGVTPGEAVMIGDSQVDLLAGKAAGVRVVAVATGVALPAVLAAGSPDFMFGNLFSLIDQLDLILA